MKKTIFVLLVAALSFSSFPIFEMLVTKVKRIEIVLKRNRPINIDIRHIR